MQLFTSPGVLEANKAASNQELFANKKPVIAKKPTLNRRSMDSHMTGLRPVSRSHSMYCAHSTQVRRAGGRDKENVDLQMEAGGRAQVVRKAPPPPPRRQ